MNGMKLPRIIGKRWANRRLPSRPFQTVNQAAIKPRQEAVAEPQEPESDGWRMASTS